MSKEERYEIRVCSRNNNTKTKYIYDNEANNSISFDKQTIISLLNKQDNQLAELKAENEKLQRRLNLTTKYKDDVKEDRTKYFDKVKDLRQQLKEKDEEIEKLKKGIKEIIDFDDKYSTGIAYATRRSIEEIANLKNYIEDLQNDNKKLANIICNKIKRNAIGVKKASDGTILNYTISKEYLDKFMKGA